ncbi:hypothetical protein GCM10009639_43940 [Kitasatospora putterlickiae]|uniref:Uncharacterized protein n=1 Tax=Kitasatospora putterlickiae TaxID=221725 RepID=A0ABN1YB71_9ACTN
MMSLGPVRGRLAVARDRIGRAATLTGALALTGTALNPAWYPASIGAAGAALGFGLLWSATLPAGQVRDTATALYVAPSAAMAGLLVTERLVHGLHWWELAADTAWTAAVWFVRPARLARVMAGREPSLTPAAVATAQQNPIGAAPAEAGERHPMAVWWSERAAIEGGLAPGTVLEHIEQTGPQSMTAVIRSARPGAPVPTVSITSLSALLDWDEEEITVAKIPGRGAGVRRLTVGRAPQQAADLHAYWAQHIAPKGMPGTTITAIRTVDLDKQLDA